MGKKYGKRSIVNKINIVIDCPDAGELAEFYSRLLGWDITHRSRGWAAITSPDDNVIAFQEVEHYKPPVWPWEPGCQGQMMHLDLCVDDLEEGVRLAIECGATEAPQQFYTTSRAMFDPAWHPFCIESEEE